MLGKSQTPPPASKRRFKTAIHANKNRAYPSEVSQKSQSALKRIFCSANFKVKMTARRVSGRSDVPDDLTLNNRPTRLNNNRPQMRIERLRSIGVTNDRIEPITAIPSTRTADDNVAGC